MADELDDRLRDLARDTEPLVVLAGPQAVRARGERRRARRRAAAAGTAAALALTVCGWQLLPRLEDGGAGTAAPAGSVSALPSGPQPSALQAQLAAALLPDDAMPYGVKWQWTGVTPEKASQYQPPCQADPVASPDAEATRTYAAQRTSAVATYRVLAYANPALAAEQALLLRHVMQLDCGMAQSTGTPPTAPEAPSADSTSGFSGASKFYPGVTAWVECRGRYVAVLMVNAPADPQTRFEGLGVDKCIALSLHRLTQGSTAADTQSPPTASGGTTLSYSC